MAGQEVVPFDPQDNPSISAAMAVMRNDPNIPKDFIQKISSVLEAEITGE